MADFCCHCYPEFLGIPGDDFTHLVEPDTSHEFLCEGCGPVRISVWVQPIQYGWEVRHRNGRCFRYYRHEYMADSEWERLWHIHHADGEFGFRWEFPYTVERVEIYGPQPLMASITSQYSL